MFSLKFKTKYKDLETRFVLIKLDINPFLTEAFVLIEELILLNKFSLDQF